MLAAVRIGILTGGGDCPGLNAVIRAAVRTGVKRHGHELVGFRYGWAGVMEGDTSPLTLETTSGILPRGGTILGTSRTNPFKDEDGPQRVLAVLASQGIDALIPIGGEDTLGVARRLHAEHGVPVVGVPKTIDNDLGGTDFTFGFHTAVQIATDAIDRLHTTAESHNRVMVVEVMGRHAGWIAVYAGMAGGADAILVPERPFDVDEVCDRIRRRHHDGRNFSIVVVSEGAVAAGSEGPTATGQTDAFGHARLGGIAVELEGQIEERTGYESRMTILGHVQRGGTPTAYDRVLATRFGVEAADAVAAGDFGRMVALHGTEIERVSIEEALAEPKLLDPALYETAEVFFG
jgi:phosphofructokinase-like protein